MKALFLVLGLVLAVIFFGPILVALGLLVWVISGVIKVPWLIGLLIVVWVILAHRKGAK